MTSSQIVPCANNFSTSEIQPRVVTADKTLFTVALTLGISALLLSLICLAFNILLHHNRIVKMSSPRLNMVIASGGVLAGVCCVFEGSDCFWVADSTASNSLCHVRHGLLCISFTLIYGPMIGKTWRVNRIFKLAGSKRVVIKDQKLMLFTALFLLLDVAGEVIWFLVDPQEFQHTIIIESITVKPSQIRPDDFIVVPACTSQWSYLWFFSFVIIKLPFLMAGLRESWWTRGIILPTINDSTSLAFSILVTVTMATVAVVTSLAFKTRPNITTGCYVGCLWVSAMVAIAAVFVPKMLLWKRTPKGRMSRVSISSTSSSKAVLQSFEQLEAELTTANAEIDTLKEFIREKETNIEKLQHLLTDAEDNLTQINLESTMAAPVDQSAFDEGEMQNCFPPGICRIHGDHNNGNCPRLYDNGIFHDSNNGNLIMKNNINNNINNNNINGNSHQQLHNFRAQQRRPSFPSTVSATSSSQTSRQSIQESSNSSRYTKSIHRNNVNQCNNLNSDKHNNYDIDNSGLYKLNCLDILSQNSQNNIRSGDRQPMKRSGSPSGIHCINTLNNENRAVLNDNRNIGDIDMKNNNFDSNIDGTPLVFDIGEAALRKSHLRRRRSSTHSVSSIASLSKLFRLRSDLNDALQLSESLRSGWSKDLEDMERYKRQVKMARRARRKSIPGFQNIAESIMASYDFQRTADNQSFISDCISSSEASTDVSKNSKRSLPPNPKKLRRSRQNSICNFYFPYDQAGNLDSANVTPETVESSGTLTSNLRGFDCTTQSQDVITKTDDVKRDGRDYRVTFGTISGRISPAALYVPNTNQRDGENLVLPKIMMTPDVILSEHGSTSDVHNAISTLTSDSLYPPPAGRCRRWSGDVMGAAEEKRYRECRKTLDERSVAMINHARTRREEQNRRSPNPTYGILLTAKSGIPDSRNNKGVTFADLKPDTANGEEPRVVGGKIRPGFHRSVSDNILSRRGSRETSFGAENVIPYHNDVIPYCDEMEEDGGEGRIRFAIGCLPSARTSVAPRDITRQVNGNNSRMPELSIVARDLPNLNRTVSSNNNNNNISNNNNIAHAMQYRCHLEQIGADLSIDVTFDSSIDYRNPIDDLSRQSYA